MKTLNVAALEAAVAGGCQHRNCQHEHEPLVLVPRCCRGGTTLHLEPAADALLARINCGRCHRPVVVVRLVARYVSQAEEIRACLRAHQEMGCPRPGSPLHISYTKGGGDLSLSCAGCRKALLTLAVSLT